MKLKQLFIFFLLTLSIGSRADTLKYHFQFQNSYPRELILLSATNKDLQAAIKYSVKFYKGTYETLNYKGETVTASGALLIPETMETSRVLSYQHGTIIPAYKSTVPSLNNLNSHELKAAILLASTGFIVSMPDYVGYGISQNEFHPYGQVMSPAKNSYDQLKAVLSFLKTNAVKYKDSIALAGYSQGAGVTLGLSKLIQETDKSISLHSTHILAGPYDMTGFAEYVAKSTTALDFINYYLWVSFSYNTVYDLGHPYSYFVNPPYDKLLADNIMYKIDNKTNEVLTKDFRENILKKKDTAFINALKDNEYSRWKTASKIHFYHGTADNFVPLLNTKTAYTEMAARNKAMVSVTYYDGKNHTQSFVPFLRDLYMAIR